MPSYRSVSATPDSAGDQGTGRPAGSRPHAGQEVLAPAIGMYLPATTRTPPPRTAHYGNEPGRAVPATYSLHRAPTGSLARATE